MVVVYAKKIIVFIIFISLTPNEVNDIHFIQIERVLEDLKEKKTTIDELHYDLINCLYLDINLINKVQEVLPLCLSEKSLSKYIIDERDKNTLNLYFKFNSVKEVIIKKDKKLLKYIRKKFGIKLDHFRIEDPVLQFRDRVFVQFIGDRGEAYAFVFDLLEPQVLKIELAFIIID